MNSETVTATKTNSSTVATGSFPTSISTTTSTTAIIQGTTHSQTIPSTVSPPSDSTKLQVVSDSELYNNNNNKLTHPLVNSPNAATPATPSPTRRSSRRIIKKKIMTDIDRHPRDVTNSDDDHDDEEESGKKGGKSRRELPAGAVATLKAWLLSPEHFTHPYPTPQDQIMLMQKTGIDKKQLKNWFTNARRRIWKPMLKKQLEQGKMTQTGSGAVVTLTPANSVLASTSAPGAEYPQIIDHTQVMQQNYQQALQQPNQQQYDSYGNPMYQQQQQSSYQNSSNSYYQQNRYSTHNVMAPSNSIGSLPQMPGATPPGSMSNLNKTDSHAVLMELFARDQDLVRQATEGARQRGLGQINSSGNQGPMQQGGVMGNGSSQLGSQHPMNKMALGGTSTLNKLGNVPSLNSWPHFSSVSSLNNLATMTGVKSITNMSGADLVSQGSLNKKGNLAQVKSIENMGRADSYAFLEVFFDNAAGPSISNSQSQRGVKRERDEDENVGLSLDGDEQSPPLNTMSNHIKAERSSPIAAPLPAEDQDQKGLKRAYDDALAARGLLAVSRSSEKLTDLALPPKMQRTISQEYLKSMNAEAARATFTSFSFNSNPPAPVPTSVQHQETQQNDSSVEVPSTTKCALCNCINVDTQLRPCGCMFHSRCLKPILKNATTPPKCPIDNITMQSAVLADPRDENVHTNNGMNTNNNLNTAHNFTSSSYSSSPVSALPKNNSQEVINSSSA